MEDKEIIIKLCPQCNVKTEHELIKDMNDDLKTKLVCKKCNYPLKEIK